MTADALLELPWRALPAAFLAAGGAALAVHGVRRGRGWARHREPAHNLRFLLGFRETVIGLALLGLAAAWLWHAGWLAVLALVIGGEETLESSVHAYAVRRGLRQAGRVTTGGDT